MAKGFKINRQGLRQIERDLQREFNKMNVGIPISAELGPPVNSPRRAGQDQPLRAMYELDAFDELSGQDLSVIADRAGLDHQRVLTLLQHSIQDRLVESSGYAAGGHLSVQGRQYVERLDQTATPPPPPAPTVNFNGPIHNSQIATGPNAYQSMTNAIDSQTLAELVDAARELDIAQLDPDEQEDFETDLELLAAQLDSPTQINGYRRALRTVRHVGIKVGINASGATIGGLVTTNADKLLDAAQRLT